MANRKHSAKQFISDIRAGDSDAALMEKYGLSADRLDKLLAKAVAAGMLQPEELAQRAASGKEQDYLPPKAPSKSPGQLEKPIQRAPRAPRPPVRPPLQPPVPQTVHPRPQQVARDTGQAKSSWYDSLAVVILLLVLIPPLGLAALVLNQRLGGVAKAAVATSWGLLAVAVAGGLVFMTRPHLIPWSRQGGLTQPKDSQWTGKAITSQIKIDESPFLVGGNKSTGSSGATTGRGVELQSGHTVFQSKEVREARRKNEDLFKGVGFGNADWVRSTIESGADVNARDQTGNTPLMYAAMNGYEDVAEVLVEKGADVNARSRVTGWTALILAARDNRLEVVELLLAKGANVNARNNNGETALLLASAHGNSEVVNVLYAYGAHDDKAGQAAAGDPQYSTLSAVSGVTELAMAAFAGDPAQVALLLRSGVPPDARTSTEATALMAACLKGHRDVAELLIEKGADVNARDAESHTSLFYAFQSGRSDVARLLLENRADVNISDRVNGHTPLMVAAAMCDAGTVQMLVDHGALVNVGDKDGNTALMFACGVNNLAAVRVLLGGGADVHRGNAFGHTPVELAAAEGHGRIVQVLVDAGARLPR